MVKGYVLSEDDRKILQTVISQFKLERKNTANRPPVVRDNDIAKANYIALVPAGGIPALTAALGTGSDEGLSIPGSAYCSIYRIIQRFGNPLLVPLTGTRRLVYNLSTLVVAAGWVPIAKDKFGSWLVAGSGGGGESPPGPGPGGGSCDLAMLTPNDTLLASDGTQNITLSYYSGTSRWVSIASGTGSGSDAYFAYPLGEGSLEFWFATGALHLSLDGLELLNCGDGCFTGGPLTGHVTSSGTGSPEEPCTGETFTICVSCIGAEEGSGATGTGTGTGTGGGETGTGGGGTIAEECCPDVLIPATLTATVTATTGDCSCYAGKSATITYGNDPFFGDRWRGSSPAPPCLSVPSGDPATRFEVIVYCGLDGVTWEVGIGCSGSNSFITATIGSVVCSPFLISNAVISSAGGDICCTGTVTLTITE